MDCVRCSVYRRHDGWLARLPDRDAGPYLDRDVALRVAIGDALRLRQVGQHVRVSLIAGYGETLAECCLCELFYPPAPMAAA